MSTEDTLMSPLGYFFVVIACNHRLGKDAVFPCGYGASTDLDVEKRQLLLIYKCDKRRKKKCSESDFKGDTNPVVYHERVNNIVLLDLKLCNYQQAPDNIWCQYWFMGSFLVSFPDLDAVIDLPVIPPLKAGLELNGQTLTINPSKWTYQAKNIALVFLCLSLCLPLWPSLSPSLHLYALHIF
ncbi:uncharacterized protein EV154DRAFT_556323 [Mucor mucedo]|uniref:uncharacterized protein n=1 Tax=Mucor mucedo TaxID=29922 RepID=UPI0022202B3B|nr:uncharacterized protein EV154DRAFT_556323 [Mucor mucedo]KAI7873262.1 hypothetical protein EV154DRAFT_556323 [Mucor mucedo]